MVNGVVLSHSVVSDSLQPHGLQPARLHCPWRFCRQQYWSGKPFPSPGDLPNPGIKPRSPALQEDSLPAEPPGKPKNTGESSLSLLQQIFLTQESSQGLLHCRQILYQLRVWGKFEDRGKVWGESLMVNSKWVIHKMHLELHTLRLPNMVIIDSLYVISKIDKK